MGWSNYLTGKQGDTLRHLLLLSFRDVLIVAGVGILVGGLYGWYKMAAHQNWRPSREWLRDHTRKEGRDGVDSVSWTWPVQKDATHTKTGKNTPYQEAPTCEETSG